MNMEFEPFEFIIIFSIKLKLASITKTTKANEYIYYKIRIIFILSFYKVIAISFDLFLIKRNFSKIKQDTTRSFKDDINIYYTKKSPYL